MADTILGGKLTVYYSDENRRKQIRWTGTAAKTDTQKMISIYDACEDLFTSPTQMDDGLIFSAETPGEYTIGKIDAGEIDPWFIDLETMEHIIGDFANFTGCALKTSGWTRDLPGNGTGNTGIVVVPISSGGTIVKGDIGQDISHADGDSGTLLDVVITGGATDYLWIRPDSNALADDWNSATGTITEAGTSHTATQSAAAHTGEMVWGNFFTQGTIQPDTHVFVYQNGERVTSYNQTNQDWWVDGQVDRAIPITDYTTSGYPVIDSGYLTVKANKYSTGYSYAIIRMNSATGGNVSAPLSSGVDADNTTGYASITLSGDSGNFNVGDEIQDNSNGARGIITLITGTTPTRTLHYYLVGDPLTDFDGGAITNNDDTGAATGSSAPTAQGPALASWFDGAALPTYAFTSNQTVDIDDDGNNEEYGITIDLNQASLAQMYEYNKYVTRRGSTFNLDGLDGQEWIGIDYAVNFATITGTVAEGSTVSGVTSGATAVVVSNPGGGATVKTALLRNTRGTFVNGEAIQIDGSNRFDASGLTVDAITPVAAATFGTLAGGLFFGSRGVLLSDYKSAEQNSFTLIDATGTPRQLPTAITVTASNLLVNDWVASYRLTGSGGAINKTEYNATTTVIGDATITTNSGTIAADVPNKDNGGRLVIVDVTDNNQEYVLRFNSFVPSTGVVTLSNIVIAAADAATTTTITETGAFATAQVGDLVLNITQGNAVSYITEVTDNDNVVISPAITGQTTGDNIEINAVPIVCTTSDNIYFPIMLHFQTAGTTYSVSMQYVADIFTRGRVRNTSAATTKIKGFTVDYTIGTGGGSFTATRIENTVYGS